MSPFAGPSLETHAVSRIRAVPPQENPKSHPSDARTTNSAAQGTKVQFWIDLGIISEPSDRQKPSTSNGKYCKSSISGLCGSCRSRIVPDLQKHQKTIPRHPPDAPRAPKGSPGSSQVLPQGLQEPSPEHPQRPHGRPNGLGRCNGRLLDLILDVWGTILELFWLHVRTPAITFNIMLCCVCCCCCCCSRLCP